MKYDWIVEGVFLERPNRFLAKVMVEGTQVMAHVKNTGRCRELLIPGVCVFLQRHNDPKRKTAYSLIAVVKGDRLINMDSQAPNAAAYEYVASQKLISDITLLKKEKTYKDSRFDLYFECVRDGMQYPGFIEVKGVTLEVDGVAYFPDAPTQRGLKHVYELADAVKNGYMAGIIFIIQMKDVHYFTPNIKTQPEFLEALKTVSAQGVFIKAFECEVLPDTLNISKEIPVVLD